MDYEANVAWTAALAAKAHGLGVAVEAELGKLAGEEDGLSVPEVEAKMTDPQQVWGRCDGSLKMHQTILASNLPVGLSLLLFVMEVPSYSGSLRSGYGFRFFMCRSKLLDLFGSLTLIVRR